jgi:hypothetical protein
MLATKSIWNSATAGLVLVLAMTFNAGQSQAGKPQALDQVNVTFEGIDVVGSSLSFDVKRSSKRGNVLVEIVVRGMDLSVPVAMDELAGGDICFSFKGEGNVPDTAPASGKLSLYSDGSADFDLFADFRTVDGDMQSYNFFLEGEHEVALGLNPVVGAVTFGTMDVDTEGRGRKPKSCRGEITPIDTALDIAAE